MPESNDQTDINKGGGGALSIYKMFREYIEHEDDLIHQRMTWFMSIQSFLIATFGFSYQKKFEVFSNALTKAKPSMDFLHFVLLYDVFLLSLVIIGISTSYVAKRSVSAAAQAIQALEKKWLELPESLRHSTEIIYLPGITGGGTERASKNGVRFARRLPKLFLQLWSVGAIFVVVVTNIDYISTPTFDPHKPQAENCILKLPVHTQPL